REATDPERAVARARALLEAARAEGDARLAGQAAGALGPWSDPTTDPLPVVVLQATVAQHLHDFAGAERLLLAALARDTHDAQAWLTLATVRRVGGRLDASDSACHALATAGAPAAAEICLADNLAWRGDTRAALTQLGRVLPRLRTSAERAWVLESIALARQLAGQPAEAEAAYRAALAAGAGLHARVALADLLLDGGHAAAAAALLDGQPASDAVLLRQAIAARRLGEVGAPAQIDALARRFDASAERGDGTGHLRERALFALALRDDPPAALALARRNLAQQREPADLLLASRAARAAGDRDAERALTRLMNEMGVRDARIDG
ncbi:MAG: hypothetical protein KDH20_00645, partial [Rhodocyclaceae bacterium]|nr:hypothetical protein [Rhodocyclaceae bacterium]